MPGPDTIKRVASAPSRVDWRTRWPGTDWQRFEHAVERFAHHSCEQGVVHMQEHGWHHRSQFLERNVNFEYSSLPSVHQKDLQVVAGLIGFVGAHHDSVRPMKRAGSAQVQQIALLRRHFEHAPNSHLSWRPRAMPTPRRMVVRSIMRMHRRRLPRR